MYWLKETTTNLHTDRGINVTGRCPKKVQSVNVKVKAFFL